MYPTLSMKQILQRLYFSDAKLLSGIHGLHRQVNWVHILDIAHPQKFLHGGELVLTTGCGFAHQTDALAHYIEELITANAAGLCIELGQYISEVPTSMITFANQHHFPLIVFPTEVRFVDITRDLHELIVNHHLARSETERHMLQEHAMFDSILCGEQVNLTQSGIMNTRPVAYSVLAIDLTDLYPQNSLPLFTKDQVELWSVTRTMCKRLFSFVLITIEMNQLLIIVNRTHHFATWKKMIEQIQLDISEMSAKRSGIVHTIPIGVGIIASDVFSIARSYQTALEALEIQKRLATDSILFYEYAGIYRYISLFADNHQLLQMATSDLEILETHDRKAETNLLNTLRVYLDSDRSKQHTADLLYIHRQTLYNRLEQIHQLLGCDLNDPIQRLSLHVAIYTRKFYMA